MLEQTIEEARHEIQQDFPDGDIDFCTLLFIAAARGNAEAKNFVDKQSYVPLCEVDRIVAEAFEQQWIKNGRITRFSTRDEASKFAGSVKKTVHDSIANHKMCDEITDYFYDATLNKLIGRHWRVLGLRHDKKDEDYEED